MTDDQRVRQMILRGHRVVREHWPTLERLLPVPFNQGADVRFTEGRASQFDLDCDTIMGVDMLARARGAPSVIQLALRVLESRDRDGKLCAYMTIRRQRRSGVATELDKMQAALTFGADMPGYYLQLRAVTSTTPATLDQAWIVKYRALAEYVTTQATQPDAGELFPRPRGFEHGGEPGTLFWGVSPRLLPESCELRSLNPLAPARKQWSLFVSDPYEAKSLRWPDALPALGPRRSVPFSECAECAASGGRTVTVGNVAEHGGVSAWTWCAYGTRPLCIWHALKAQGRTS